jgi:hypothetical protein
MTKLYTLNIDFTFVKQSETSSIGTDHMGQLTKPHVPFKL